jgi:hypothetical protein
MFYNFINLFSLNSNEDYQLYLFCCTKGQKHLIEFPNPCSIKVNGVIIESVNIIMYINDIKLLRAYYSLYFFTLEFRRFRWVIIW